MSSMSSMSSMSYWNILPDELQILILEHRAAIIIQNIVIKIFHKKYGINWKNIIQDYAENLDLFCYLTGIDDPWQDYINADYILY